MIIMNLMGGMGNLMFQYAYARALQEELCEPLLINAQFMNLICLGTQHRSNTNNALLHFKLNNSIKWMDGVSGYIKGVWDTLQFLFYRKKCKGKSLHSQKSFTEMSRNGLLFTDDYLSYYCHDKTMKSKKKIIGGFNSPKYFAGLEKVLREELKVVTPPSKENEEKIEELLSCNAVCIHIRRGDYLTNNKNANFVICGETYYSEGMHYVASHTSNPIFYIFSDNNEEVAWIKDNYHFDYPVKYVDLNNPDYEEIRLMYTCKHFVISNSTFSWWGAYLSDYADKIIIAPSIWNKEYTASQDVYLDNMVLIDGK